MDTIVVLLVLVAVAASFAVSASAGFGGSLILVPALALVLGSKSGVALAALLLAGNNLVKAIAYRRTLPLRQSVLLITLVGIAAAVGARLLLVAPENVVTGAVIASFGLTFMLERRKAGRVRRRVMPPLLALGAGLTSGFTGTSGPLKGLAVKSLALDRAHVVSALSLLSLVGDVTKASIFAEAGLIPKQGYYLAAVAIPLMFAATSLGRRANRQLGERGFTGLFWGVMVGYTTRLLVA